MKIEALQLGESLDLKAFTRRHKTNVIAKEPLCIELEKNRHAILFRYGVVVLWNTNEAQKKTLLKSIQNFIASPFQNPAHEEAEWGKTKAMSIPKRQLISVAIARSVVMDSFEQQADELITQFRDITNQFKKSGHSSIKTKHLLKFAGAAMSINNQAVGKMALLDKPDFTWENPELDQLFTELDTEYEIAERYTTLTKKLEMLTHDTEFIMNYIETRKTNFLELVIVVLFIVDIGLILWEKFA